MNKSKVQQFLEDSIDYFDGGFGSIDSELSDQAWFQAHVDLATYLLKHVKDIDLIKPKSITGYDVVMYWIKFSGKFTETINNDSA